MLTDTCTCGIKPTNHAHIVNSKNKKDILWFKGAPIIMDDPIEKTFFMLNTNQIKRLKTRRKAKINK